LRQPGVNFFTQDTVEALFGQIRAKGGHNDNPTVEQFKYHYESKVQQLLTQYEGTARETRKLLK